MTDRFNVLAQQLFQKNVNDCSVEELENLTQEYPYFAPAQYVLLARLKEIDYNSYQAGLQKAILYYHDPLAFDHFLNAEEYKVDFTALPEEEIVIPPQNEENESTEHIQETVVFNQDEVADLENSSNEIANATINEFPQEQLLVQETFEEETAGETNTEILDREEPPDETTREESLALPLLKIEESQPGDALVFEPYHTVDYFASQGIKLSQEEVSKDKFGKQLKSFTEWLKTMKKLPVADQVKSLDSRSEEKVENLAAHSVEGEEVYTEAMAEVWARQGNKEKAMEVYNKLSLLNPSKRAYFAAKIDSLK